MKTITIYFTDGDQIVIDCLDTSINNGFINVFIPENEEGVKTVQSYNTAIVESFTFEQKDEKGEEA